jgi:hypothetical protein
MHASMQCPFIVHLWLQTTSVARRHIGFEGVPEAPPSNARKAKSAAALSEPSPPHRSQG